MRVLGPRRLFLCSLLSFGSDFRECGGLGGVGGGGGGGGGGGCMCDMYDMYVCMGNPGWPGRGGGRRFKVET